MLFNINHSVRIRLTEHGRGILERQCPSMLAHLEEDQDGWSRWQFWVLMQEFGNHVYNGCQVPFETEIDIEER